MRLSSDLESAFCDVLQKMLQMQNREERWSWKSQGKICCPVCGNPVTGHSEDCQLSYTAYYIVREKELNCLFLHFMLPLV